MVPRFSQSTTMPRESLLFERGKLLKQKGFYVTKCVCLALVLTALGIIVLTAILGHFYFSTKYLHGKNNGSIHSDDIFYDDLVVEHLTQRIQPEYYRIRIEPNVENNTFNGHVQITLKAHSCKVNKILLHAHRLNITKLSLTKQVAEEKLEDSVEELAKPVELNETQTNSTKKQSIFSKARSILKKIFLQKNRVKSASVQSHYFEESHGRLSIVLKGSLEENINYVLDVNYEGFISSDSDVGLFAKRYQDAENSQRVLLATNFAPTHARRLFPCFDQPGFKASFELSLLHHENYTAISNTRDLLVEDAENQTGYRWTHFQRTPRMSPHMVSFLITNISSTNTTFHSSDGHDIHVRLHLQKPDVERAALVLQQISSLLGIYEKRFGMAYPLEKLDLVTFHDFYFGSNVAWGVIVYDESVLNMESLEYLSSKVEISMTLAEGISSQWFGGLVTSEWWDNAWIIDGLAYYYKFVGVSELLPEIDIKENFEEVKQLALSKDVFVFQPFLAKKITNEAQIFEKLRPLYKQKAVCLLRMLNHSLGLDVFEAGVKKFLQHWKRRSVKAHDFWNSISDALISHQMNHSIFEIVNSWANLPGYPIVNIQTNSANGTVTFSQEPYALNSLELPKESRRWHIPICFKTKPEANETCIWLTRTSKTIPINFTVDDVFLITSEEYGYYRINYSPEDISKILNATNSSRISSDALSLARAGHINYDQVFETLLNVSSVKRNPDYFIDVVDQLEFLDAMLEDTPELAYYHDFIFDLIKNGLDSSSNDKIAMKPRRLAKLNELLKEWDCRSERTKCRSWAIKKFNEWRESPEDNVLPSKYQHTIFSTALKFGGLDEILYLLRLNNASTDEKLKKDILQSLGYVREHAPLLLTISMTDLDPKEYLTMLESYQSTHFKSALQHHILNHWTIIQRKFNHVEDLTSVIEASFKYVATQDDFEKYLDFVRKTKVHFPPISNIIKRINEEAKANMKWRSQRMPKIQKFLHDRYSGNYTFFNSTF